MNSGNPPIIDWDLIDAEQALSILKLLSSDAKIAQHICDIIIQSDIEIKVENISAEICLALNNIDVHDLWQSSGGTRYGYIDPADRAYEMVEECIEEFQTKFEKYLQSSKLEEAKLLGLGIIHGLYQFEYHSHNEFQDWTPDASYNLATSIINDWNKRCNDNNKLQEFTDFIEENCPEWSI